MPATIGGVERHVEELATRLALADFSVLAYDRPSYSGHAPWSERMYHGVRVITLPSIPTKHFDTITHTFLATLHALRERVDVYHFHGVGPSLLAWIPRVFHPRARVIVTFHCVDRKHAKWGWFARKALKFGEWAACRFPHSTVAVGETLAAYCRDQYGRTPVCIPNGVAIPVVVPPAVASDLLARFGLESRKYLLVVSRLIPHKGVHVVVEAFKKLRASSAAMGLKLAIVGEASFTDEYVAELLEFAADDANILFLGRQNGRVLDVLYQNAFTFVHASTSEGLPIVVLEAAAAGAVPIVSNIPEHEEIIQRIGGMTFAVNDPDDLIAKLEVIISGSAALPVVGQCIREAVERAYNWDVFAHATAELYREHIPQLPWSRRLAIPRAV